MNGEVATRSSVSVSLQLNTLPDLRAFCSVLAGTEMVPKAYKGKPDDILVAMLHGQEVGLPHLQALQSIAVVNGIPSIYGDAALAMVRASGKLEDFDEWIEVENIRQDGPFSIQGLADAGKSIVAFCRSKRIGMGRERITTYSVQDAKRAGLWDKAGPWTHVPQRMLMWRARGWNLRDQFGDVLKGLAIYEEAMDIEASKGPDGSYRSAPIQVEASEIADMSEVRIDQLQAALEAKQTKVQGDGLVGGTSATRDAAPLNAPVSQDAPAPPQGQARPAPQTANETKANGTKGNGLIQPDTWKSIIMDIDMNPDWATLKLDWKIENKVDNVMKLTDGGQAHFLAYMRQHIGEAFQYPK